MNWKGKRVLVTGAGGFIGSHLTEELARRGASVRGLVRYNARGDRGHLEGLDPVLEKRVDIWAGDVTDPYFVSELVKGRDFVFHLAALIAIPYSYHAPASYVATNVQGTLNILEACRRHKVGKLVHTSTSEAYGTALYTPIDEKHPLQGQSPYSASKIAADALAESFYRSFGLPVAILRPFNTFGPRQSARAVIPTIISQLVAGANALSLGDTRPVRDFNFVSDTVEGFLAAAASPKSVGRVTNIGSGRGHTIKDTALKIMALLNRKVVLRKDKKRLRPKRSEVMNLVCDSRQARKLFGWRPRYRFEEGLALTIQYVKAHRDEYRPDLYTL